MLPVLAVIPVLLLSHENAGRAIFIIILLLSWVFLSFKLKNFVSTTIFILVFVSVFNVTFQLSPANLSSLGQKVVFDCIFTNWMVPTLSIIDLFMGILFYELCLAVGFSRKVKYFFILLILFFVIPFLIHLATGQNIAVLYVLNFARWLLYFCTVVLTVKYLLKFATVKEIKVSLLIFLVSVLFQIIIANLQVMRGASIGLDFLGESKLVVQVYGVSFIDFMGQVYLRG
jgi:hypothetical protein